ncbi:MAG: HPr family phosphocarrier protein [Calditrichaeota bacterium]|nr:MAG: HPr family phosphocarrier protein [Calditrichota bacterium]
MVKRVFQIRNRFGLHARPAALLVKTTGRFKSKVLVNKDGLTADGKSIMGLMTLAAEPGSQIEVVVEGEDEQEAMEAIREVIENNFFEDQLYD